LNKIRGHASNAIEKLVRQAWSEVGQRPRHKGEEFGEKEREEKMKQRKP